MNKLTHTLRTVVIAGLLLSANAQAGQAEIDQIESATSTMNVKALTAMQTHMQGYDLALTQYRLALTANLTGDSTVAKKAINKAMDLLETLDKENPEHVEIKTLLAQVYGYKIALEPMKGIYYGPKSQSTLAQAETLSANNPRVLLVKGIGAVNTPAMFGGSEKVAFDSFSKAISQFTGDTYSNYHWGHAEAYTWRGMMHMQRGDLNAAKADWQSALEIDPDYGWAKSLLAQNQG